MTKRKSDRRWLAVACLAWGVLGISRSYGTEADEAVEAELRGLAAKVPTFAVLRLPAAAGELVLTAEQSLTIEHLRVKSEPVAAMIEGMALVKPLEYTLRHGEVKIDISARRQFKQTLPIVRRVKHGPVHIVMTYDPQVVHGGKPREIVLTNFDNRPGLTLRLPADQQTRIFVLREQ